MRIVDMKTGRESASMKALPKRKGNHSVIKRNHLRLASMKALPKRKGNFAVVVGSPGALELPQ